MSGRRCKGITPPGHRHVPKKTQIVKLPCFGKPEPGEIFIRGGSATIQKRKGRGHRKQEGTEGGGSATIQRADAQDSAEGRKERVDTGGGRRV